MNTIRICGLLAASLLVGAAHAQTDRGRPAIPPISGETTGGSPPGTGSIAPTGRTKPPGSPVGEGLGTRPDLEKRSEQLDRRIRTGICRGC